MKRPKAPAVNTNPGHISRCHSQVQAGDNSPLNSGDQQDGSSVRLDQKASPVASHDRHQMTDLTSVNRALGTFGGRVSRSILTSEMTAAVQLRFDAAPLTDAHRRRSLAPARAIKRKGPCLNRRTGQNGNVFQHDSTTWNPNAPSYGRYWEDATSGPRRRKIVPLGRCRTRTIARQKLRAYLTENKINDVVTFYRTTAPSLTFEAPGPGRGWNRFVLVAASR